MNPSTPPRRFQLLDLAALVVGYGLASLAMRPFWPSGAAPTPTEIAVIALFYAWLGLAMSGPFVLLVGRPAEPLEEGEGERPSGGGTSDDHDPTMVRPCTGAELAWMMIGIYWIITTVLFSAFRGDRTTLGKAVMVLFPLVGALGLFLGLFRATRGAGPRARARAEERRERLARAWTHRAAVGLLLSWPLAWVALILLGKTL
jgi:hypothetical protein